MSTEGVPVFPFSFPGGRLGPPSVTPLVVSESQRGPHVVL